MKISFHIIALVLAVTSSVLAQEYGEITGKIIDADYKSELPGAKIEIIGTGLMAETDINGFFKLTNVPDSTYTVQITMMGYQPLTLGNIKVSKNETTILKKIKMQVDKRFILKKEKRLSKRVKHDQTQTIHIIPAEEIEHTPKK